MSKIIWYLTNFFFDYYQEMARTKLTSRKSTKLSTKAPRYYNQRSTGVIRPTKVNYSKMKEKNEKIMAEIKKYQESTDFLIPKSAFKKVVLGISEQQNPIFKFDPSSLKLLQESAEALLVEILKKANRAAFARRSVTICCQDISLVLYMIDYSL